MRLVPSLNHAAALLAIAWGCQMPNPAFEDAGDDETLGEETRPGDGDGDGDGDTGDGDGDPGDGDGDGEPSTGDGDGDGEPSTGDGDGDPNECNPGQMLCGDMCIDTEFDPDNCGQCDMMCTDGQLCAYNMCKQAKFAFVTLGKVTGNFGGVEAANQICNTAAAQAGLPQAEYRAWVSESDKSPSTTFNTDAVWMLRQGQVVAWSWEDLTSGVLEHPINQTEWGEPPIPSPACNNSIEVGVWTGTVANGTAQLPNCSSWGVANALVLGRVGDANATVEDWSSSPCTIPCDSLMSLYCFQL